MTNPFDDPREFDYVTVAGQVSPGVCVVSGAGLKEGWEVKTGKGIKGATLTRTHRPPIEFTLEFTLYDADTWDAWEAFESVFEYDPVKKTGNAVEISHPLLARRHITSAVTKELGQPVYDPAATWWKVKIDMIQYSPPPKKNATGTPGGSTSSSASTGGAPGAKTPQLSAQDEQQKEIDRLLKIAQSGK
jgi:hypothetical protein